MLNPFGFQAKRINRLLIFLLLIILFGGLYYFNYNKKAKVQLYSVVVSGLKNDFNVAIPYWVANSIKVGDKDGFSISGENVEIVNRKSFEGGGYGKYLILQLKITAHRDRSNNYTYRNQPLNPGEWVDFNFGVNKLSALITSLDEELPEIKDKKMRITIKKVQEVPYIAENLTIGDEMVDDQGNVMAKIVDKKVTDAQIRTEIGDRVEITTDDSKRDIELIVDIQADEIGGVEYFSLVRKVRPGERITLFFKKATVWDGLITKVEESPEE